MRLNHSDGHNVEDAASVRVFGIGQLFVTVAILVSGLNLAVHLTAIRAFEVHASFTALWFERGFG